IPANVERAYRYFRYPSKSFPRSILRREEVFPRITGSPVRRQACSEPRDMVNQASIYYIGSRRRKHFTTPPIAMTNRAVPRDSNRNAGQVMELVHHGEWPSETDSYDTEPKILWVHGPAEKQFRQIGDDFTPETLGKRWKAVYGRRRPPVPVPFMHFARGMTGRDGTPLTGPVPPVKTVTATIPTSRGREIRDHADSLTAPGERRASGWNFPSNAAILLVEMPNSILAVPGPKATRQYSTLRCLFIERRERKEMETRREIGSYSGISSASVLELGNLPSNLPSRLPMTRPHPSREGLPSLSRTQIITAIEARPDDELRLCSEQK
ncbi:hypothetical protein B0H16DRAFT_1841772, partial [Mycena metata]